MDLLHPQFAVVRFSDGWHVLAGSERLPRAYDFSVDAEEAAIRPAKADTQGGQGPEVLVQGRHGEVRRLRV